MLLMGVTIGMLAVGLAIPLIFGSIPPASTVSTAPGSGGLGATEAGAIAGPSTTGQESGSQDFLGVSGGRAKGSGALRAGPAPPGVKLEATDRGVTADGISVGVLIGQVGGAVSFGFDLSGYEIEERAWPPFIDGINARGGILGRKIKPYYRPFDAVQGEARAACLDATQDKKVFAAFNVQFFALADILCVTKENRTPLVKGDPESGEDIFQASEGYLSSTYAAWYRQTRNLGWELHRMGALQGKKIGITAEERYGRSLGETLITVLRDAGYRIEHVSWFSADSNTAQSQVPGEVLEMKRKGVQVVLMLPSFIQNTAFVQHAESQQFFPLYAVNDIAGNAENVTTSGMPPSFEPAIAITFIRSGEWRTNIPESPTDRACREIYEKGTGETLARSNENGILVVMLICDISQRFEAAATGAGVTLTRDRLSSAIQALGERPQPFTGGGSYRVGKFDGSDFVRTKRWSFACKCFIVTEDFRRARY